MIADKITKVTAISELTRTIQTLLTSDTVNPKSKKQCMHKANGKKLQDVPITKNKKTCGKKITFYCDGFFT